MSILGRPNKADSTPCVGICSHNTGGDVCKGCGRTVNEVYLWLGMTSEEKIEVKKLAKARITPPQSGMEPSP